MEMTRLHSYQEQFYGLGWRESVRKWNDYLQEEVISDSGRFTYTEAELRSQLKSLEAHNTLFDEDDSAVTVTDSWGYEFLPLPIHQRAEAVSGLPDSYLFSNGWVTQSDKTSFYGRDFIVLEKLGVILVYDAYRGQGETITTTFNFHEGCRISQENENTIQFQGKSASGRLALLEGATTVEDSVRSNVYNQLEKNKRVVRRTKVRNGQVNNLTLLTLDRKIRWQTLSISQSEQEAAYPDATGISIRLTEQEQLDFYFLFNDIVKGSKLLRTPFNQYLYGKIVAFDAKERRIKIK